LYNEMHRKGKESLYTLVIHGVIFHPFRTVSGAGVAKGE
jgi:hypothetical protein